MLAAPMIPLLTWIWLQPASFKLQAPRSDATIRSVVIDSASSRADPSHLNDTPSSHQPVWVLGQRSFSLAALIYWLFASSPRKTSGHVGRANDEKRDGEAVD
jgi:hypothetical protein